MYYINITDLETSKSWKEEFESYYFLEKDWQNWNIAKSWLLLAEVH